MEVDFESLSQLVPTMTVWHNLNNSTEKFFGSSPIAYTSVRRNKQIKIILFENSLEMLDKL